MKVLIIHNFHRSGSASGDDQVFRHEVKMLENAEVDVLKYTWYTDDFDKKGKLGKLGAAISMLWSIKAYREVRKICAADRPDIVHIHTFFPLLSPSVFVAAHRSGAKVVQTLHDTRYVCPNAASLCHGTLCNLCMDGKYFRMVKNRCFKNSAVQSFEVALIFKIHRWYRTFYRNIDCYICLNDEQISLLQKAGFNREKLIKKYNSVPQVKMTVSKRKLPERYVVYCGRIGEEKGISVLCKTWTCLKDIPLVIMGAGPQEEILKKFIADHAELQIIFLGYVPHNECQFIMKQAEFVLLPSVWYEGCSMTVLEAFSLGKPVVATDIGFMHEAIKEQGMDTVFSIRDCDSMRKIIRKLWEERELCQFYGRIALSEYQKKYSEESDIKKLVAIYTGLIDNNKRITRNENS